MGSLAADERRARVAGMLPGLVDDLEARLLDAFDLKILWNKTAGQAFALVSE